MTLNTQEETLLEDLKKFRDRRVWTTKKIRMESERRVEFNNKNFQILTNYYSISTLAISVVALYTNDQQLDIWNLVISIFLIAVTMANTTLKYDIKAVEYKDSYLALYKIETEFDLLIDSLESSNQVYQDCLKQFNTLKKTYIDILATSDNHIHIDFLTYKHKNDGLTLNKHNLYNFIYFYGHNFFKFIGISFIYLFPLFVIYLKMTNGGA